MPGVAEHLEQHRIASMLANAIRPNSAVPQHCSCYSRAAQELPTNESDDESASGG